MSHIQYDAVPDVHSATVVTLTSSLEVPPRPNFGLPNGVSLVFIAR